MKDFIVVVIGPSGAGKSTFIEAMGVPTSGRYVTSQPMVAELTRRGQPINHDTIFALSEEWYGRDPYWQVPLIIKALEGHRLLVVDGPRRLPEVRELTKSLPAILVKIASSSESRFEWLKKRKKINLRTLEEFKRLEKDEWKKMGISQLMEMAADVIVLNSGSEAKHRARGQRFGKALHFFSFLPRRALVAVLRMVVW